MGLMLKYQRNGQLRRQWYGVYTESNGTRKVVNLDVRWQGTPPSSGRVGDQGDRDFEDSRRDAEDALAVHQGKARRKGRVEHLTERLIESKTGRTVQYARIEELAARWRGLGRESAAGEAHLGNCDAHFKRFVAFMQAQNRKAQFLYEVTPEDTAAFARELGRLLAPATKQYGIRLLRKAFTRFLPVGCANPFEDLVGRRGGGDNGVIHRKPFTPEELHALLETARGDEFMYPLIVTAACTGMRRGDVCRLRWRDVDLPGGMLTVKTSKTGGDVEIPIFGPLRDVLTTRRGKGLVFPEAAALLKENPDALTWRFKKVVARALDDNAPEELPVRIPAV